MGRPSGGRWSFDIENRSRLDDHLPFGCGGTAHGIALRLPFVSHRRLGALHFIRRGATACDDQRGYGSGRFL